jgi:hypothetical protein
MTGDVSPKLWHFWQAVHRFVTFDSAVKITGLVTLFILIKQLRIQQRAHLLNSDPTWSKFTGTFSRLWTNPKFE